MNKRIFLLGLSSLLLAACGPSDETLSGLGRSGRIQTDAPIRASSQIVINAPVDRVWDILTDVPHWPKWQRDVKGASIEGPLQNGASFTWRAGGMTIHSQVVLFSPNGAVGWTGRASTAKAIHVLTLTALDSNKTQVESRESMDGLMLSWFYSSSELQASEDRLLQSLKLAAESSQPETGSDK